MNYKESKEILEEIKKADKILLNCHRGPDPDSIGSALALSYVLEKMGKHTDIVCPSERLYDELSFLRNYDKIKKETDFSTFDYTKYDLFVCQDSSSWDMVTGSKETQIFNMPIVVIDHHKTNTRYGQLNLIDAGSSSVGELLYKILMDWDVEIDKDTATALLTAIIGDTGIFKYPNTEVSTFKIASDLMSDGADKDLIVAKVYRSVKPNLIKFWGETLRRVVIDEEAKFVYSAVPYSVNESLGKPEYAKETACDLFAQITDGTEFGIMMLETEPGKISVSLRARNKFDTSKIALELGGGGHKAASGAKVEGLPFDEAVKRVLDVARKYADEFNSKK